MQLKLVGAQRYVDLRISEEVIERGAIVDIDDDTVAADLLDEVVYDSLNNANPLFIEVTDTQKRSPGESAAEDGDDQGGGEKTPTTPARTRSTSAKSKKI